MERTVAALYLRVSTEDQAEKWSLAAQERILRDHATAKGWEIYKVYRDEGVSGGKLDRPGLDALLADAEDGLFNVALVVDQDRLSRLEPVEWEYVKKILRDAGCRLATPYQVVDLGNEDEEFITDLLNLLARRERKKIKARARRGLEEKALAGEWHGRIPLGYDFDPATKKLVINPVEAEAVRLIFRLHAEGLGYHLIAQHLNQTPYKPKEAPVWNRVIVSRIISRRIYTGALVRRVGGRTIEVSGAFPAIITEEEWIRAQDRRRARVEEGYRVKKMDHRGLLTGILFCAECSRSLGVRRSGTYVRKGQRRPPTLYYAHHHLIDKDTGGYRHPGCSPWGQKHKRPGQGQSPSRAFISLSRRP